MSGRSLLRVLASLKAPTKEDLVMHSFTKSAGVDPLLKEAAALVLDKDVIIATPTDQARSVYSTDHNRSDGRARLQQNLNFEAQFFALAIMIDNLVEMISR